MPNASPPPGVRPHPPFAWTPKVLKKVADLSGLGMSKEMIAASLDISTSYFYDKIKQLPELQKALDKGVCEINAKVAGALLQNALPHEKLAKNGETVIEEPGLVEAQKFWLARRGGAGWKEDATPIQVTVVPIFATQYQDAEKEFLNGNGRIDERGTGTVDGDSGISEALEEGQVERDGNQAEDD